MKPILVTVAGSRSNTLAHQLQHYAPLTSGAFIVIYQHEKTSNQTCEEIRDIAKQFGAEIYAVRTHRPYDWEQVTRLYNEVKNQFPDSWWLVADDDELQVYWDEPQNIIRDCDQNGWKYVTGGFIDRIGQNGVFPKIEPDSNLWELFPVAGFFRYPLSRACPNKVTLCKGSIQVTNGQHYVRIDGKDQYGPKGWQHPWRYPVYKEFVQVHHFKWDETAAERIKAVAEVNQSYSFSDEYRKMYDAIRERNFRIDVENPQYGCQHMQKNDYWEYRLWKKLTNLILHV